MNKKNRTDSFKIRLSEDESKLFRSKAENYSGIAAMIRTAVERLDNGEIKTKFAVLQEFSERFGANDMQFRGIAANLNQAMHRANRLASEGILTKTYIEESLYPLIVEVNRHIIEIKQCQKALFGLLLKMN